MTIARAAQVAVEQAASSGQVNRPSQPQRKEYKKIKIYGN